MPILEDGQLFERYRVHRWLGSGIAGESYEAEDRILQRKVTLKLIHPWATLSDSARRQFFREMQGISLLDHPYLATVLDYGETDGRIYVARRYVSSGSLLGTNGRLWFRPPLAMTDAFKYAHQLAQTLQYIHQHGYLHGSLTFANILVLRGPNTEHDTSYAPFLIADVGLAHFVRRFGHPRIETLPVSAAPEQHGKRVTPASDQFALAVLLYFWLAGRPPYLGTSSEIEHQKLSETITPLHLLNPGITLEQSQIIQRALMVYPEERYPSALAFAEALIASLARQQTIPVGTNVAQPETPRDLLQIPTSEMDLNAQIPSANPAQPSEEITASALPPQARPEPYRSALEQLLARPPALSPDPADLPDDSLEMQEEAIVLFPALPETPRVEESTFQAEFLPLFSQETTGSHASSQTDPQPLVPGSDNQINEPGSESPGDAASDAPGSSEVAPPNTPAPNAREDTAATEWDAIRSAQIEDQVLPPQGEFAANNAEQASFPSHDLSPASDEQSILDLLAQAPQSASEQPSEMDTIPPAHAEPDASMASFADTEDSAALAQASDQPGPEITSQDASIAPSLPSVHSSDLESAEGVMSDESYILQEEIAPVLPASNGFARTETAQATDKEATASISSATPAPTPGEHAPAETVSEQAVAESSSINEDERPALAELVEGQEQAVEQSSAISPEETTVNEESAQSLTSDQPTPANPASPDVSSQAEITPTNEASLLAESAGEPSVSSSDASETRLEAGEISLEPHAGTSMQEAPETTSEIYPQIDEATFAPRLLISSPYTSSAYEFLLLGEETNIGRAGASDLYLEQDNLTSRHHALIKRIGERVLIFDKRSHNGVFINGQKIEVGRGYELADGDHIGIGNYELIFRSASTGHISQLI